MGKMKVCCECMVGLLWEFEEFSRKAWVVDISVAECAYLFSREKMIGKKRKYANAHRKEAAKESRAMKMQHKRKNYNKKPPAIFCRRLVVGSVKYCLI